MLVISRTIAIDVFFFPVLFSGAFEFSQKCASSVTSGSVVGKTDGHTVRTCHDFVRHIQVSCTLK